MKQRLGIGTPLGEASPEDILGLLAGAAVIELDNGCSSRQPGSPATTLWRSC